MNIYNVIKEPLVTEKSAGKDASKVYMFHVDKAATKIDVRRAVEKLFNVKVADVRTLVSHGKRYRVGRHIALKSDWKKAMVSLKEGFKIELFEGV